jgi:hypothetical protein
MSLGIFHPKLFGIGKRDIRNFMNYLHEKVYLGQESVDMAINRYKNIHVFANIFMKRKLDIFLHEMNEGRDVADALRREMFISSMDHHLLRTAQSFSSGLNIIVRPDRENIDLSIPSFKGYLYFSTIPLTFLPMSGELGKGVEKMISGIGSMRAGGDEVAVAIPFFLKDPFAFYAGWGSAALMTALPLVLVSWHAIHLPSYIKFNRLKEIEYGLSLFTPLMQMAQNGVKLHEGFEYMSMQVKHPALKRMLREITWHYEQGETGLADIFKRYGFGQEVSDVIDEIEKSGISPATALARGVESLEIRRARVRSDYAMLLAEVPKWVAIGILIAILTLGSLSYFDAFLGTSITR